jgi:hypothetical protein
VQQFNRDCHWRFGGHGDMSSEFKRLLWTG